ncbi:MAG: 5'-3' exonuclease H3TH domain-containing protein [Myxococcales bacterium]|jgi:5'-3' exonuclease
MRAVLRATRKPARALGRGKLMKVHLIDGTYELFRAWFGAPEASSPSGQEVGATRGLLRSFAAMLRDEEVTHVGCAFDHTVESFRNELFDGYKTGEGLEAELLDQFPLAERASRALGLVTWPMVEFEADDALAAAAMKFHGEAGVDQVVIASPDKDLCQCVRGREIVTWDRRRNIVLDEDGVRAKFGVSPESIPDYLALVGDSADGIPGIPRWGAKSAASILDRFGHLDRIPADPEQWGIRLRGSATLARNLEQRRDDAMLFRRLATLRVDVLIEETLEDLRWKGPNRSALQTLCEELGERALLDRI